MTVHDPVDRKNRSTTSTSSGGADPALSPSDGPERPSDGKGLTSGSSTEGADRAFKTLVVATGWLIVAIIGLIAVDLVVQAMPAISADKENFLTSSLWSTNNPDDLHFGILDLLKITVLSSVVALVLAVPVSIGIATFLVQYAPPQLSRPLSAVIDLLAAVPSIIFGIWGATVVTQVTGPMGMWLSEHVGWFPLFSVGNVGADSGKNVLTASIVLAIMILPIITSISREVIRQTPSLHQEAALALGATKWEKIRMTCFPYARSGIIAASMLALGRALGETIAVLLILNVPPKPSSFTLLDGGSTFASKIANGAGEFSNPTTTGAYIAAGLVLFVLTFIVNAAARAVAGGKVNS